MDSVDSLYSCNVCNIEFTAREPSEYDSNADVMCPSCHSIETGLGRTKGATITIDALPSSSPFRDTRRGEEEASDVPLLRSDARRVAQAAARAAVEAKPGPLPPYAYKGVSGGPLLSGYVR